MSITLRIGFLGLVVWILGACGEPGTRRGPSAPNLSATGGTRLFSPWPGYRGPVYDDLETRSLYLPMRDGVRLAADVHLPVPRGSAERLPTVLIVTRYWRSGEGQPASAATRFYTAHGYAVAEVDERGTGASFGTWPYPWAPAAVADYAELVDWCAVQPWSNGRVVGLGTSYLGTTAQLLAVSGHPAVAAVVPRYMELDVFTDIVAPGGVPLAGFLERWSELVRELDAGRVPGADGSEGGPTVRRVDVDRDGSLLTAALDEHRAAPDFLRSIVTARFRDQPAGELGIAPDDFSVHSYRAQIEASGVPIFGWGSWMDAATADAVIARFLTFSNPQRAIVGAWSHGGGHDTDPFRPADAPVDPGTAGQRLEVLRFLEAHARERAPAAAAMTGLGDESVLIYTTLGADGVESARWRTTATWPPAGIEPRRWYLATGGTLALDPPATDAGSDRYAVDLTASTGERNRWLTEADGGDVVYGDRAAADAKLATYTSAPLAGAVEVTGHPVVDLYVASTHDDGAIFAYLEAVSPAGEVVLLTEGVLRMIHRTLRSDLPATLGPRPTFRSADARPLVPGQTTRLRFTLLPTSAYVPAGWRLRLALGGHDASAFSRFPASGDPVLTIERHRAAPSSIVLPMKPCCR